jgi:hypothetical protein
VVEVNARRGRPGREPGKLKNSYISMHARWVNQRRKVYKPLGISLKVVANVLVSGIIVIANKVQVGTAHQW